MINLNLPTNVSDDLRHYFNQMREKLEASSKRARAMIISQTGVIVWEEPLDEYNKRMEVLDK